MHTVITYILCLITGVTVQAQNTIEVSLTDFSNNDGTVKVGLYNEAGDFLGKAYQALTSEITNKEAEVTFSDVPDGTYAISGFHDEDNDGELKMRFGMIPAESYGCSNGAKGFFGPPKWEDAKFEVKNGEVRQLEISL